MPIYASRCIRDVFSNAPPRSGEVRPPLLDDLALLLVSVVRAGAVLGATIVTLSHATGRIVCAAGASQHKSRRSAPGRAAAHGEPRQQAAFVQSRRASKHLRDSQNHLRISTKLILAGLYTTRTASVCPDMPEQHSSYVGLGV